MVTSNASPNMFLSDRILGHSAVVVLFVLIGFQLPLESSLGVVLAFCGGSVLFETAAIRLEPKDTKTLRILAISLMVIGAVIALSAPGVF